MSRASQRCVFCKKKIEAIDYKDPELLGFLTGWSKIKPRKETRACSQHQRRLAKAIKRARQLGLLPYVSR